MRGRGLLAAALFGAAWGGSSDEVVVYTSVDQVFSAPVFQAFERESGVRVRAVFDGTTTMHVAALFAAWGDAEARAFLASLEANGVRVASSNGEVKRLVVSGEVAFGLTDTDDANEAMKEGADVEVVYPDADGLGTLVMPTSVVLMSGGPNPEAGRRLVDHLLSAEVERRMAESAAHMPLRPGVPTPERVPAVSEIRAMQVDYARVAEEMERIQPWLREWVGL